MSSTEEVCPVCYGIPLRQILQDRPQYLNLSPQLPPWDVLEKAQCKLCQLIRNTIYRDPGRLAKSRARTGPNDSKLELVWLKLGAPGARAGFRLIGRGTWAWLGFAAGPSSSSERSRNPYNNQLLRLQPRLESMIDVERVKIWVRDCETHHTECQLEQPLGAAILGTIRFIDVVGNCIVEKTLDMPKYVALSYVWGAVPNFRLTTANKFRLMQPGAIELGWKQLPITVRDAIELTRRLGVRFLWVDSMCLTQNDEADLERGIGIMDHIYELSWLTIVAAGGHDANAGLVGLHPGDRLEQGLLYEVKPGIFMGAHDDLDTYLTHSVYESRAWTFQEHLLARRKLYFVGNRLFFRCRESEHCETAEDDLDSAGRILRSVDFTGYADTILLNNPLQDYARIIDQYTGRSLTKDTDILRALAGIIRRVSDKVGYPMLEGIPVEAFEHFIIFEGRNLRRRAGFPSYSWVGWRGAVYIYLRYAYQRSTGTRWIKWIEDIDVFGESAKLTGGEGLVVGQATLDGLEDTEFFKSREPCEVVLLSELSGPRHNVGEDDMYPRYQVMLLEWSDGVAERRGIGTIQNGAIWHSFKPGPQWKEITLG
ncbi:hypothetical protein OQA88_9492 [Cercophora sp. LCS_1]